MTTAAPLPHGTRRSRRRPAAAASTLFVGFLLVLVACGGPSPSPASASPTPAPTGTLAATPAASPVPTPVESGSTNPPLPSGPDALALELVADGLAAPIGLASAADGSGRLFVLEREGVVRVVSADGTLAAEPFLDIRERVLSGGERGLLGLAFHPDFAGNGRLFVHYSGAGDGATVLAEYRATADRERADPASERRLLTVAQPFANHNGGNLAFGPDGHLYIGLGDGGAGGDPFGNAQSTDVLLGKVLRLDVDAPPQGGRAYAIPRDNPFVAGGVRPGGGLPEIWAYGLRNPWQISFDPEGGDLYIADVGQAQWEEINRQPGDSRGGENYGWAVMEGRHCYRDGCDQAGFVKPIAEYSHDLGCSVTGGQVYRGSAQPELVGVYVFADYCSGTLFTLQVDEGTITPKPVLDSGLRITAFGTDGAGEIYLVDIGGGLHRVVVDG